MLLYFGMSMCSRMTRYSVGCLWQATVRIRLDFVEATRQIWLTAKAILLPNILLTIARFCESGKDCNFQAQFLWFGQGTFRHSAILARRGNKQKVHFRRHFDIAYWTEHYPFRNQCVTHRANKFTVHSACQTNQRVQQQNLRVHPA